jgi:glycyl-tRNA synthetase beta chain
VLNCSTVVPQLLGEAIAYATPRRLAVLIEDLASSQADKSIEKRGPALQVAFNAEGEPSKACLPSI